MVSLGLAAANAGEDPLASTSASKTLSVPGLSNSMASGAPSSGKPSASSSGGVSDQGFSLGHGFPLIPAMVVNVEKEPSSNWSLLHSMFYSLSFLSQRVEASTCPKCMGSDHTKAEYALSALEPQQEPMRSHPIESVQQSGPAKKRICCEGTPQSSGQNSGSTKSVCFSYNEGQCFRHPKPCDIGSTNASGVVVIIG